MKMWMLLGGLVVFGLIGYALGGAMSALLGALAFGVGYGAAMMKK